MLRVVVICVFLAACARQQLVWVKPDVSEAQYHADRYDCLRGAQASAYAATPPIGREPFAQGFSQGLYLGQLAQAKKQQDEMFQACMMGKGYQLQDAP